MQYFKRRFKLKRFITFIVLTIGLSIFFALNAQSIDSTMTDSVVKKAEAFSNISFTNQHVWRGSLLDETGLPHVQPLLGVTYHNFEAGVIGSYNTLGSYFETDLYLMYTKNWFRATITDFYVAGDKLVDYFDYSNNHHFVADIYFLGVEKFPIEINVSTILHSSLDVDTSNKSKFTSYFEIRYLKNKWDLFVGGITGNSDFYLNGDESSSFNIVNVGVLYNSSIDFENKSIPLTMQFCINPQKKRSYLTFVVTF